MKIARIISLLVLVSLLVLSQLNMVFAQGPALTFTPDDGKYNTEMFAGRENTFYMTVKNTGAAKANNIQFTSEQPKGWTVEFDPDRVEIGRAHV